MHWLLLTPPQCSYIQDDPEYTAVDESSHQLEKEKALLRPHHLPATRGLAVAVVVRRVASSFKKSSSKDFGADLDIVPAVA